jgi:hypothetical protein
MLGYDIFISLVTWLLETNIILSLMAGTQAWDFLTYGFFFTKKTSVVR